MDKQSFIFLFWNVLGSVLFSIECLVIWAPQKSDLSSIIDRMMLQLIDEYRPSLRTIIIFDRSHDKSSFSALSISPSPGNTSFYLISNDSTAYKPRDSIGIQGIIVIERHDYFIPPSIVRNLMRSWPCDSTCTLIVISKDEKSCLRKKSSYLFLNYLHLPVEYFICPQQEGFIIMTRDWYGNQKNPNWSIHNSTAINTINQYNDRVKVIYYRKFKQDNISNVWEFIRIDKPSIHVGVISPTVIKNKITKPYLLNTESEYRFKEQDLSNIQAMERYWKFKFFYSFIDHNRYPLDDLFMLEMLGTGRLDIILSEDLLESQSKRSISSPLINEEDLVIVSPKRSPATPLEKIIRFYGSITLISLLVLSVMTSIVIWIKTRFKLASAIFNTFRLLVNTAISVPIDTLPLRIFFSVIFLYFLIMHATFSGHLAKFLTVETVFNNLESMDDLRDPSIREIGIPNAHFFDLYIHDTTVIRKFNILPLVDNCVAKIHDKQLEACIGTRFSSQMHIKKYGLDGKIYISRQKLWTTRATLLYRNNFYWREKFDKTLLFLIETRIWNWWIDRQRSNMDKEMAGRQQNLQVDFRPIDFWDLQFAFILLIGGSVLGFACFLIELLIKLLDKKGCKITSCDFYVDIYNTQLSRKVSRIHVQSIKQN